MNLHEHLSKDCVAELSPHITLSVIEQLAEDTGIDMMPQLLPFFIDDLQSRFLEFKGEGLKTVDWWQQHCHSLKSSAATYGALSLSQMMQTFEADCKAHTHITPLLPVFLERKLPDLFYEIEQVLRCYRALLKITIEITCR